MKLKVPFKENTILRVVYLLVFVYIITNEAIYSPDTKSYLNAMPYRHPGYVLFLKSFQILFSNFFDISILAFQAAFALTAVHLFFKKTVRIFDLNTIIGKLLLIAILLFPFFKPLYVANNICPEGISYALFLLFTSFILDFIQHDSYKKLVFTLIFYVLLALTRGQFILTPLIFAVAYFFKNKSKIVQPSKLAKLSILFILPFVVIVTESTYHKLKDGIFMTTPFGFVNASTAAFFVANESDAQYIESIDDKVIFEMCFRKLQQEKLLMSSQKDLDSYVEYYNFFHNHVPLICNKTIHQLGKNYYFDKALETTNTTNATDAQAIYNIEKTTKNLTLILITKNFKNWIHLYYANISHGFYSSFLLWFITIILVFSSIKLMLNNKIYILLFIACALTLSNAMLVAFASHSIMRYLFYNYVFIYLIFIILIKLVKNGIKN